MKTPSTKIQISNKYQWPKFKTDRTTARHPISDWNVLVIGICNFDIVCNLSIGIWDFSAVSEKSNRSYLNQLELTLTFSVSSTICGWHINKNKYKGSFISVHEVIELAEISNNKSQKTNKFQWPKFKIPNKKTIIFEPVWNLEFEIWDLFEIWRLRFGI